MAAIRPAREEDLPILQEIERQAGRIFASIGMAAIAEDEPPTLETLRESQQAGRAWVSVNEQDVPIAYLLADLVNSCAHIEQVSVRPEEARKGIGRALVEHLADWARSRGLKAMTLTTFKDVPWNGPYYGGCGFRTLAEEELTPGLRKIRAEEAARGLDAWPRVCMRREL